MLIPKSYDTQEVYDNNQQEQAVLICVCSCSSLDHSVRFSYWPKSKYDMPETKPLVTLDMILNQERSFWKRVVTAFRYLFTGVCRYGTVAEIILEPKDFPKIREWLDIAEK